MMLNFYYFCILLSIYNIQNLFKSRKQKEKKQICLIYQFILLNINIIMYLTYTQFAILSKQYKPLKKKIRNEVKQQNFK
tara:strand:+ start:5780 stop:6016 length:237 start_codon:yes stop_codon:yes gene_type:complete